MEFVSLWFGKGSGEGYTAGDFLGNALTNSAYVGGSWSNGTSHFFKSEREALSYINSQYDFSAEYELIDHGNVANRYEMGMTVKMTQKGITQDEASGDPACPKCKQPSNDGQMTAAFATAAAFSIADGPLPVGEIIGIGVIAYALVHANSKNSPKPNIVYEIYKYNSLTGYQTMKYGISSRADFVLRTGNPRPEYQVVALNISQPFNDNSFYGYTILQRTPDRASALAVEKQFVEAYMLSHGGLRPPLQIIP